MIDIGSGNVEDMRKEYINEIIEKRRSRISKIRGIIINEKVNEVVEKRKKICDINEIRRRE
jgi:hypothetical protein